MAPRRAKTGDNNVDLNNSKENGKWKTITWFSQVISETINAPIEKIDIPTWCFTLSVHKHCLLEELSHRRGGAHAFQEGSDPAAASLIHNRKPVTNSTWFTITFVVGM